jgi:hypothetical protein
MSDVSIERVEDGDPNDPDVSYWVYYNEQCVGYLERLTEGWSLCFTGSPLPIKQQIACLISLKEQL